MTIQSTGIGVGERSRPLRVLSVLACASHVLRTFTLALALALALALTLTLTLAACVSHDFHVARARTSPASDNRADIERARGGDVAYPLWIYRCATREPAPPTLCMGTLIEPGDVVATARHCLEPLAKEHLQAVALIPKKKAAHAMGAPALADVCARKEIQDHYRVSEYKLGSGNAAGEDFALAFLPERQPVRAARLMDPAEVDDRKPILTFSFDPPDACGSGGSRASRSGAATSLALHSATQPIAGMDAQRLRLEPPTDDACPLHPGAGYFVSIDRDIELVGVHKGPAAAAPGEAIGTLITSPSACNVFKSANVTNKHCE